MIIMGADLSYSRTGLCWIDSNTEKVIQSRAFAIKPGALRLKRAAHLFEKAIVSLQPHLCVIEDNAYGAPSRVVVVKLSMLNTILKLICELHGIDWLEISPSLLKKFVTGKGTAEKSQVAQELLRKWGIAFDDDPGYDLSDATAAAVWGADHRASSRRGN